MHAMHAHLQSESVTRTLAQCGTARVCACMHGPHTQERLMGTWAQAVCRGFLRAPGGHRMLLTLTKPRSPGAPPSSQLLLPPVLCTSWLSAFSWSVGIPCCPDALSTHSRFMMAISLGAATGGCAIDSCLWRSRALLCWLSVLGRSGSMSLELGGAALMTLSAAEPLQSPSILPG